MTETNSQAPDVPAHIDTDKPSIGRMYDYLLGGTENFEADRAAMKHILQVVPESREIAHSNRIFLQRAVKRMAEEYGMRQFIDVGAGLPTRWNSHEVAQQIDPDARVVYVDSDPVVVQHGRELLRDADNVTYLEANVRDVEGILEHPETKALIDFTKPVGLVQVAIWHFIPDRDKPLDLLGKYLDAVPSGSYIAISHFTGDSQDPAKVKHFIEVTSKANEQTVFRAHDELMAFFDGLELVPPYQGARPGLAHPEEWGSQDPSLSEVSGTWLHCGVARKP